MALRNNLSTAGAVALLLAVAACGESPVATPDQASLRSDLALNGEIVPHVVTLCKVGPVGTATFSISATGGILPLGNQITLSASQLGDPNACAEIWIAQSPLQDPDVIESITVTETAMSAGTKLDRILTFSQYDGSNEIFAPINTATVRASYNYGATIIFKNVEAPIIVGFKGCTPGYWKQTQHFDSWPAIYTQNQQFSTVFANAFPGMTLLQVLGQGGGGLKALGRHTVAALLNSSSFPTQYGMTSAQVVTAFNQAYASGQYSGLHAQLETYNERGCPLN